MHCFDPASGQHTSWTTSAEPGGVILSASGEPVVATPVGLAALERTTGELTLRVVIEQHRAENRTNDAKVDPRGRAWVGTMAFDKRPQNGALYRVDGEVSSRVVDGLTISNGPAFDDAGTTLYLADTALGVIDVFDVEPETGALASRRRFVDLSDAQVWPDGMTVDDEGMLWVAIGRASAVYRYRAKLQSGRHRPLATTKTVRVRTAMFRRTHCLATKQCVPARSRCNRQVARGRNFPLARA